jgi:hypothetical protein
VMEDLGVGASSSFGLGLMERMEWFDKLNGEGVFSFLCSFLMGLRLLDGSGVFSFLISFLTTF